MSDDSPLGEANRFIYLSCSECVSHAHDRSKGARFDFASNMYCCRRAIGLYVRNEAAALVAIRFNNQDNAASIRYII